MNLWIKVALIAGLVIGALVAVIAYTTREKPVEVVLGHVDYGPVEATVANTRVGTVKACRRAYLAPATGGQVAQLAIREGDAVKKGQILMEIWNQDLQSQVGLEIAETNAARARAEQSCALADGAEREARRQINLQKRKNLVSQERVDTAVTEAQSQRAGCNAAQASIRVADARIKVAKAAVERTLVRAPFPGVVAEVNAELGEFVTPSPPGIATLPAIDLLDISCLYVSAPIDEVDAPSIETGMKACVSLDAFPERRCSAIVSRIAPYVLEREKQARTVEVEAKITEAVDLAGLLPGYSADIEVLLEKKDKILRIPTEAVLEGNKVLVYESDGLLAERSIKIGLSNWRYTEVESGLEEGDQIVVSVGREGVIAGVAAIPETKPQ